MHWKLFYRLLGIQLWIATVSDCQEPNLSYRLDPGHCYTLHIEIQQNSRSESMEREDIQLFSKSALEFRVDSIDKSELIHMSVRYHDLLLSMIAPGMGMDLNSGSGANPILAALVDSLERIRFRTGITPAGELAYLEGLGEAFDRFERIQVNDTLKHQLVLATLKETYGPSALRSLTGIFLWIYPVIQPMTNWTNDVTYFFNTKPVRMVNRYFLARNTDRHVIIQGLGMLNGNESFRETTSLGEVTSEVSGNQTFDFQLDKSTGWLNRCVSRQQILIETTILESSYLPVGLKIPSYTETVFEVTGTQRIP